MDFSSLTPLIALMTFIGVIISAIFNKLNHDKIVGNDLKHLEEDVKVVIQNQDEFGRKIDILTQDVSYLKGAHETQLKVIEFLKDKKR